MRNLSRGGRLFRKGSFAAEKGRPCFAERFFPEIPGEGSMGVESEKMKAEAGESDAMSLVFDGLRVVKELFER